MKQNPTMKALRDKIRESENQIINLRRMWQKNTMPLISSNLEKMKEELDLNLIVDVNNTIKTMSPFTYHLVTNLADS